MAGRHAAKPAGNWLQRFLASFTYEPRHGGNQRQVGRSQGHKRAPAGNARARFASPAGQAHMGQPTRAAGMYGRSNALASTARRRPR